MVFFAGMLGGVVEAGGETILAAACALAAPLVTRPPLLIAASASRERSPMLAAGPQAPEAEYATTGSPQGCACDRSAVSNERRNEPFWRKRVEG